MNEIKSQPVENFRNIKPDNEMSFKELTDAVRNEFNKASAPEISGQDSNKEYFDDNGIKYREGNDLLPNVEFDRNGYTPIGSRFMTIDQIKSWIRAIEFEATKLNTGDLLIVFHNEENFGERWCIKLSRDDKIIERLKKIRNVKGSKIDT
jgi:hypothetical protein